MKNLFSNALEAGAVAGMATIFTNPIILVALLIFAAVIFIVAYAILWAWGLFTAAVLFVAGIALIYIAGKASPGALEKYPYLLLIPVGLGGVGYLADHVPSLALVRMGLTDSGEVIVAPTVVAAVCLVAALLVVIGAILTGNGKKHRKRCR